MISKIKNFLKEEYVNEYKPFDYIFLGVLLLMQIIVFIVYPSSEGTPQWINICSIIAGITGTVSTVLCAKKKITYYVYGFIQIILFLIINLYMKLWVESGEQLFYLIACIVGIFVWKKNLKTTNGGSKEVNAKKLTKKGMLLTAIGLLVFMAGAYYVDKFVLFGNQPELDTLSLALTVFAQILCTGCYKEQWILWIILDIVQVAMYIIGGNYILATMYIGWTINCIYGWIQWRNK